MLDDFVSASVGWRVLLDEFLSVAALYPLLAIDFRMGVSDVISVSDASEKGAGVCVARSLTPLGERALRQRLVAVPNLLAHKVILLESGCGVGGVRRAFELLGIRPATYLCFDADAGSI